MSDRAASKAWASFSVQSLLVCWAFSCNMSLLPAIKTISQWVSLFLAVSMVVVRRTAFITKSSALVCWTISKQMFPWTALQASLLISFLLFCLEYDLLLLLYLLLNSFLLLFLYLLHLLFGINNFILWILESLFELSELVIQTFSLSFVLFDLLCLYELRDLVDFLLNLLCFEMNFLFHHFCHFNKESVINFLYEIR